jgi:hypothetical protein
VIDPSLAPAGKHTLHAYTPATEPYALWEGLDRRSPEYKQLKEERSQVLWDGAPAPPALLLLAPRGCQLVPLVLLLLRSAPRCPLYCQLHCQAAPAEALPPILPAPTHGITGVLCMHSCPLCSCAQAHPRH